MNRRGSAIITVPYVKINYKLDHRVYDRHSLSRLVAADNGFSVAAKKDFYCYNAGKWKNAAKALQTGG